MSPLRRALSLSALFLLLPLSVLAEQANRAAPETAEEPSSTMRQTVYAQVTGMRTPACETYAESKLAGALDNLDEVTANHETGWIEIVLIVPQPTDDDPETSSRWGNLPETTAVAIRSAIEDDCGFGLASLQTTPPGLL